jgi:hypothetical protein
MFRRLSLPDDATVFTIVAFVTALTIYLLITWRALRMQRGQLSKFEQLPFQVETPSARHESPPARTSI